MTRPYRVAVLWPEVRAEAHAGELALLLWVALADACLRVPGLGAIDLDDSHVTPVDGAFVAIHALHGREAGSHWFAAERRDEVVWLEAPLTGGAVRLRTMRADGRGESFDAIGRDLGAQVRQVVEAWLRERGLAVNAAEMLPAAGTGEWVAAAAAVAGPLATLAARRGGWVTTTAGEEEGEGEVVGAEEAGGEEEEGAEEEEGDEDEDEEEEEEDDDDGRPSVAIGAVVVRDETPVVPIDVSATIEAVPAALRALVLRALAVVDSERCGAAFAEAEPEHPWSLYRAYQASEGRATDRALLWRCIAAAPGWAAPYLTLRDDEHEDVDEIDPLAPTELEEVSAAGIGALLAPDDGEAAEIAGDRLDDDGRTAEALRAARRAVALDPDDADRHLALLALHTDGERLGTWLAEAHRAGARHGCPMDPYLPWYPDQRKIDLAVATALMNVGRLDEAIALRQNRLEGVEATWPRHTSILQQWRRDPSFVAWSYAREAHARGDDGRVVEGFGRMAPEDGVDLGMLLDGLVATGREREAPLVWAWFGHGCGYQWPYARLCAARALAAAGSWAEALRQLVLAQVLAPARDDHAALAHVARLFAVAPIDELAAVVAAHLDAGAPTIARRVAREIADVAPHAAGDAVIRRALGAPTAIAFDPAWLAPLARLPDAATRAALDSAFAALDAAEDGDALAAGDRLVTGWVALIPVATMEDPHAAARGFAIAGAQALARYLCATTQAPSPRAGALRTVAAEAFTAAAAQRHLVRDAELLAVLAVLEPAIAVAEPMLADGWLAFVERSLGLDERWHGALDRAAAVAPRLTARLCGPEQLALLGWRAAAELRHKPEGWAARAAPTLERLAWLTGGTGASEWAIAIDELATANAIDAATAIDALSTAHYFVSEHDATPTVRLAHRLFAAGRAEVAFARLCEGLPAAGEEWRDAQIATFRAAWKQAKLDVPIDFERAAGAVFTALQKGDPARAERVGRWCVALDPDNQEAHRNLGLAFANQGKVTEALAHLVKATPEQATQILSGVLHQAGKLPEAMAVLDVASRWYTRCDQWLTFGGVAYAAMDNPRTVLAYDRAWQLDRDGIDASQLNAYAGVLDEVGEFARCEVVARRLIEVAGKDKTWLTNGWNHLSCALLGQGQQKEAIELATRAVKQNPSPDNRDGFAATLARARANTPTVPTPAPPPDATREAVFQLLDDGDPVAAAALLDDPSWRVRRGALRGARFRHGSDNRVPVAPRARAAAAQILGASDGALELEAALCRAFALEIRAQDQLGAEPPALLGDRMTRDAFYVEFRARGGVVLGEVAPPPPPFEDREVLPGTPLPRASDYVALLRDLAAQTPEAALAARNLDGEAYRAVAIAWAAALAADATLVATIERGLAT